MTARTVTPEQEAEIKRLTLERKSVRAIGAMLKLDYKAVWRARQRLGLAAPPRPVAKKPRPRSERKGYIPKPKPFDPIVLLENPQRSVALRMLKSGDSWSDIRNVTGMSFEELKKEFPLRFPQ